jgi:hypothetical protein
MRRGERAVGERSHRGTLPEWRGYRRLGAAVIVSAVRDLEQPTRDCVKKPLLFVP